MALNDVWRMEIFQNIGSEITMNVLHAREITPETLTFPPAQSLVSMAQALYEALALQLSEDWSVVQIAARRLSASPSIPVTLVLSGGNVINGAVAGQVIPSASAVLISLYSLNAARTGRGRIYLPGLSEAGQNEGQLTAAQHAALQTIAETELVGVKGPFLAGNGTYSFAVFGGGVGMAPEQDVAIANVRSNLATQRRRRAHPGFGP
jgi:hypothetical protein